MSSDPTLVEARCSSPADSPGTADNSGRAESCSAVFVLDRRGIIIDTSETRGGLTGFRFEELIGTRLELLLDGKGSEKLRSWFEGPPDGEGGFEGVIKCRDEEVREACLFMMPLAVDERERAGAVVRIEGRGRGFDISGPRPEGSDLLDRISDPGMLVDRRGVVLHRNWAAKRLLGSSREGDGGPIFSYFPTEERDRLIAALGAVVAGGPTPALESAVRRGDGSLAAAEIWLGPAGQADQTIIVMIQPMEGDDEERTQGLLDNLAKLTGDCFALVGKEGRIAVCNQNLALCFGYSRAELLSGLNISDLVVSNLLGAITASRGERLARDTVVSVDTFGVSRQGELFPLRLDVLAVAGADEERIHLICRVRGAENYAGTGPEKISANMERQSNES